MNFKFDKNSIIIFILGISSAIPYSLTMSTMSIWLSVLGISAETIGLFALVGIPYSMTFLWAPLFDHIKIRSLQKFFKHRTAWVFVCQIAVILTIVLLSFSDPSKNLAFMAITATLLSFFSSCQDVAIDTLRVRVFEGDGKGVGASNYVTGYRLGMVFATTGVIMIVSFLDDNWQAGYLLSIIGIVFAMFSLLFINETEHEIKKIKLIRKFIDPFIDFMKHESWFFVILFILTFRISDSYISVMSHKFFIDIGYSKEEIALINKVIGLIATIIGAFVSVIIIKKMSMFKALFYSLMIQSFSNLMFIWQYSIGYNIDALIIVTFIEKFTGCIAMVTLISYISSLCNSKHVASQYAMLSSISILDRTLLASPAGFIADYLGWEQFFIFSSIIILPALIFLFMLRKVSILTSDTMKI